MNPNRTRPPTILHIITYAIACLYFRLRGWKACGEVPQDIPKFVMIFGPHTSHMDNFMLAMVQASYGFDGYWLAAEKLFKNPLLGRLIYWGGARPVDRDNDNNLVDQYIEEFKNSEYMVLGMAPKGSRKPREYWKTGFYWIAYHANVPVVCLGMDYSTKRITIGPIIEPSGDIYADMETIREFYSSMVGCHPERMSPVRVEPDIDVRVHQRREVS